MTANFLFNAKKKIPAARKIFSTSRRNFSVKIFESVAEIIVERRANFANQIHGGVKFSFVQKFDDGGTDNHGVAVFRRLHGRFQNQCEKNSNRAKNFFRPP